MLVLKLLEEKDMYGYEMIDTLRGKSKNVFELKAGTLYPLLHGLEEKGFVESYEKEAVGKIRKYYHITRSGKKELKKKHIFFPLIRPNSTIPFFIRLCYSKAVLDVMGGVCFG